MWNFLEHIHNYRATLPESHGNPVTFPEWAISTDNFTYKDQVLTDQHYLRNPLRPQRDLPTAGFYFKKKILSKLFFENFIHVYNVLWLYSSYPYFQLHLDPSPNRLPDTGRMHQAFEGWGEYGHECVCFRHGLCNLGWPETCDEPPSKVHRL